MSSWFFEVFPFCIPLVYSLGALCSFFISILLLTDPKKKKQKTKLYRLNYMHLTWFICLNTELLGCTCLDVSMGLSVIIIRIIIIIIIEARCQNSFVYEIASTIKVENPRGHGHSLQLTLDLLYVLSFDISLEK